MDTSQREAKRALRSELIARRARLGPDERAGKSRAVADRIEQVEAFREASVVALYAALGGEVDPAEIARRALRLAQSRPKLRGTQSRTRQGAGRERV